MKTETDYSYLQYELDRERANYRALEERTDSEREQRRREMQERIAESSREADDWHDALQKQARLMGVEAGYEQREDMPEDERWFTAGVAACQRALEIWSDVADAYADELARLEVRRAEIQDNIVREVGTKLLAEDTRSGWQSVANALVEQEGEPRDWLSW